VEKKPWGGNPQDGSDNRKEEEPGLARKKESHVGNSSKNPKERSRVIERQKINYV